MNKFEFKNLVKSLEKSLKERTFFKTLRTEVNTGANGTQDYVVKKELTKIKLQQPDSNYFLATVIHLKFYRMRCVFKLVNFFKL